MRRALIAAALLCACTPQPASESPNQGDFGVMGGPPNSAGDRPEPTPQEARELARIERLCTDPRTRPVPGWDCGWSSLAEARQWEAQYHALQRRRPG